MNLEEKFSFKTFCSLKTESRDRPGSNFLHKGMDPVNEHIWHPPHADRTKEFRALTQEDIEG
jgi:hypothetical protein